MLVRLIKNDQQEPGVYVNMKRIQMLRSAILVSAVVVSGCQLTQQPAQPDYAIAFSYKGNDGRHVFFADANGQFAKQITNHTRIEGYPSVSPDGKKVAFYGKYDNNKTWSIHVANVDGSNVQRITNTPDVWDSAPSWSADSQRIVFAREYKNAQSESQYEIWIAAADGSNVRQIKALSGLGPKLISDNRILFFTLGKSNNIYIANIDGSNIIQLTNDNADNWYPDISPNEQKIAYMSNKDGNREIYTMNIDGSNQRRITYNDVDDWNPSWSSNGEQIVFTSDVPNQFSDVYKMNHDGSAVTKLIAGASQVSWIRSTLPVNPLKSPTTQN